MVLDVVLSEGSIMVRAEPRDVATSLGQVIANRPRCSGQIDNTGQRAVVKSWVWQRCTVRNYPGAK